MSSRTDWVEISSRKRFPEISFGTDLVLISYKTDLVEILSRTDSVEISSKTDWLGSDLVEIGFGWDLIKNGFGLRPQLKLIWLFYGSHPERIWLRSHAGRIRLRSHPEQILVNITSLHEMQHDIASHPWPYRMVILESSTWLQRSGFWDRKMIDGDNGGSDEGMCCLTGSQQIA